MNIKIIILVFFCFCSLSGISQTPKKTEIKYQPYITAMGLHLDNDLKTEKDYYIAHGFKLSKSPVGEAFYKSLLYDPNSLNYTKIEEASKSKITYQFLVDEKERIFQKSIFIEYTQFDTIPDNRRAAKILSQYWGNCKKIEDEWGEATNYTKKFYPPYSDDIVADPIKLYEAIKENKTLIRAKWVNLDNYFDNYFLIPIIQIEIISTNMIRISIVDSTLMTEHIRSLRKKSEKK